MQTPPTPGDTEPRPRPRSRSRHSLPAILLHSTPNSLLIVNAVILTVIVDALLWYRWAVTQGAGWLFAAGVLSLLVLTLLANLHRLGQLTRQTPKPPAEPPRPASTADSQHRRQP